MHLSLDLHQLTTIALALVGVARLATGVFNSLGLALPKPAANILQKIGDVKIETWIRQVDSLSSFTSEQKQRRVAELLKEACEKRGLSVSSSTANLVVEYVYQTYRRKIGK